MYSEIQLLRPPKIKTSYLLKPYLQSLSYPFHHFLHPMNLWLETTFGTVQKWSLRPFLDSPKGGLNIGILLYIEQYYMYGIWMKAMCLYNSLPKWVYRVIHYLIFL